MQHTYLAFLSALPNTFVLIPLLTALLWITATRKCWAIPLKLTLDIDVLLNNTAALGVSRRLSYEIFSKHCRMRHESPSLVRRLAAVATAFPRDVPETYTVAVCILGGMSWLLSFPEKIARNTVSPQ